MSPKEANDMYDKAAKSYSSKGDNVAVPQDFTSYIVDNSYVVAALRTLKEGGADEQDWADMVQAFLDNKAKKAGADSGVKENKHDSQSKDKGGE